MKKIVYFTIALALASCTKDMTEIIDVSEVDGSDSTVLVFSRNSHIDNLGVRNLHEFRNGRLLVSYASGNNENYYYVNMLSSNVEQGFFTDSKRIPATKDYFLHKWSSKAKLLDKNNEEVTSFNSGTAIYQADPDWFMGQYESNTFIGYSPNYNNGITVASLVNNQIHTADIYYKEENGYGLGFPCSKYMYLNNDYLFFVNIERINQNSNFFGIYLNKYTHSLQFIQRTNLLQVDYNLLHLAEERYKFFPNNNYNKLIISNGTDNGWNIIDNNFQVVGNFNYAINFNSNQVFYGQHYVTRRGEIVSWNFVDITIYDINSGLQKTYNIREKFEIPTGIPQNDVYILWVGEREAGGFYVLYQQPKSGKYNAYLKVLSN